MKTTYIYIGLVVLVIAGLVVIRNTSTGGEGRVTKYDDFAQCLTDAGAKFYGAFWCPHCAEQKKLFENSKKLPYYECSTPDGRNQTQECTDLGITGYPTWIFADESRVDHTMQLSELSEKTNCALPQV